MRKFLWIALLLSMSGLLYQILTDGDATLAAMLVVVATFFIVEDSIHRLVAKIDERTYIMREPEAMTPYTDNDPHGERNG